MDSMYFRHEVAMLSSLPADEIAWFLPDGTFHKRDTKSREAFRWACVALGSKRHWALLELAELKVVIPRVIDPIVVYELNKHARTLLSHACASCGMSTAPWQEFADDLYVNRLSPDEADMDRARRLIHCSTGHPFRIAPFDVLGLVAPSCPAWPGDFSFVFVRRELDIAMALSNYHVPFQRAFELVANRPYNEYVVWTARHVILSADRQRASHTYPSTQINNIDRYLIDKYDDLYNATFDEFEREVREYLSESSKAIEPLRTSSPNACALCRTRRSEILHHDHHPIFSDVNASVFPYGIDANMLLRASSGSPDLKKHIKDRRDEFQKIAQRFNWQTPASHSGIHESMSRVISDEIIRCVASDPPFGAFYDRVTAAKRQGYDLGVLARTGWRNGYYGPRVVEEIRNSLVDCEAIPSGGLTTLEVIDNVLVPEVVLRMTYQDVLASSWHDEDKTKLLYRSEEIMAAAGLYGEFEADGPA